MKTNSKAVNDKICQHIIDCVYDENGDIYDNIQLAATRLYKEFDYTANYPANLQRIPNNQDRFQDFMRGLPFSFIIYYNEMNVFLNSLEINFGNKEYSLDETAKLYYYLIYKQVLKHKISA